MPEETPAVANRSFSTAPDSIKQQVDEYWGKFFNLEKRHSYASIFRDNSLRLNVRPGFEDIYIADFVDAIEQNITNGAFLSQEFFSNLFEFRRNSLADNAIDPRIFESMWDKVFDLFLKYGIPADMRPKVSGQNIESSILMGCIKSGGSVVDLYKLVQAGARVSNNQLELIKILRDGKPEMIVPLLMAGADFKSGNLKRPLVVEILESYSQKFKKSIPSERNILRNELSVVLNTLTKLGCDELTSLFATEANPFSLYLRQAIVELIGDVKTGDVAQEFADSVSYSINFAKNFRQDDIQKLPPSSIIVPTSHKSGRRTAFKIARDANIVKEIRARDSKDWYDYVERMKLIGFDVNVISRDGISSTLLSECICKNDKESFLRFLRDPDIDLNAVDQFGNRAIDYAVKSGDVEYLFALLGDIDPSGKVVPIQGAFSTASPYGLDASGLTLLMKAKEVGGDYLVALLRDKYKIEGPDRPLIFADYEFSRGNTNRKLPEWEDVFDNDDIKSHTANITTPVVSKSNSPIFKESNPSNTSEALTKRLTAVRRALTENNNEVVKAGINSIPLEDMIAAIEWSFMAFDGDEKVGSLLIDELARRLSTGSPEAIAAKINHVKNMDGYENFLLLIEPYPSSKNIFDILTPNEMDMSKGIEGENEVKPIGEERKKPSTEEDFFGGFGL